MNGIEFLGEEDFLESMDNENRKWRETCVKQDSFKSFDGTGINYYYAIPKECKKAVVFLHGFCEFFGKYHEYAWYLYRAGFAVFFPEQRGHGYSEGKCKEVDVVYIDDYETYVEDFHFFLDKVVLPKTEEMKKILIAHSMGGAVGALFLEKYPEYFEKAVLSSPMLKMKNNTSPVVIWALRFFSKLFGMRKSMLPGQHHFDGVSVFETSSACSKPRYDYMFEMRKDDWHYQTYGASIGWALASLDCNKKLMANAAGIRTPLTVFTAGDDHLIDPLGYADFKERVPGAVFVDFPRSRHEIFNSDEDSRIEYFSRVLDFLSEKSV